MSSFAGLAALVLLPLSLVGPAAAAQSGGSGDPPPGLESFLRLAAENHPGLKAAFERSNAAAAAVAREKGWPDPVLSYGWYIEPVQTAVGPQQHRIGLSQTIPWFGELSARGTASEREALAAEQDLRSAQLALFERVADAYYEYAYLAESISITRDNLALLAQQETVARTRYRTNSASYSDLIKAQVEQGTLQDRLRSLEDHQGALAARLNESLGLDPLGPVPWPVSLDPPQWTPPAPDEVRARLDTDNPDLQSLDHRIEAARSTVEVEGRRAMPDFNVGIQTILTGESDLTSFDGQGKDAWVATFSMSLPLWRGQYRGAQDAARARGRMLEHESRRVHNDLLARAEEALFGLRDAERKIALYGGSLLPKARQALDATARAFQTGDASFLDYVDAQRTLLSFQLDHARARADYGERVLEVARLAGSTPVPLDEIQNHDEPGEGQR